LDNDDDLLGGGGDNEEVTEFESSFPAIDSRNEVRDLLRFYLLELYHEVRILMYTK
jgi:hypothetical protein